MGVCQSLHSRPKGFVLFEAATVDMAVNAAGDSSTPLDAAVGSSTALMLRKKIRFDGLQVELFQDIDDPIAAAEGESMMSHMRSAELQLAADLEGSTFEAFEEQAFEREAVSVEPQDEFESSSIEADNNRCKP